MTAPWTLDPALQWVACLALALLMVWSAGHKLRDLEAFRAALAGYRLLPRGALRPAVAILIVAELAIGLGLLLPGWTARAALAAAGLLALYSSAIAANLLRGRREIDCGCAGPAGRRGLGPPLLVRNALLIGVALCSALPAASRELIWLDGVVVVAGLATAALLYVAAELAGVNSAHQRVAFAARGGAL
jgi:hypothetical protein